MTLYHSAVMAKLVGNSGGAIQSLPAVTLAGGRKRAFIATITLASQASGSQISIARLPIGAAITDLTLCTDTSLATATLAVGDIHGGNSALYAAAATLTATDTPTQVGATATLGVPITTGYDCVSGAVAPYEDVILTVGTAALPAAGTLKAIVEYVHD